MEPVELRERIPSGELVFTATRSSGPGGQNVNKVNTKVQIRFNVLKSSALSDREKDKILTNLKKRITADGDLIITSQSERSMLMNKKKAENNFFRLLAGALTEQPERKSTHPTKASQEKRLEKKRKQSHIKKLRSESDHHNQEG
jgi:ribosome-associated protein